MTTFTANYLFPKPGGTDSPDGATQISTLADAVDAALATTLQSFQTAMTGGILTLTSSFQDIAGTSQSITVTRGHAVAMVVATFDVNPTVTTSNNVMIGILNVDGVGQTTETHCDDRISRATVSQTYRVSLAAGTHTLKLQAKAASGTFLVNPPHTTMLVTVLDLP